MFTLAALAASCLPTKIPTTINAAEARRILADFDVILDVRTQQEWEAGHLDLPSVMHVDSLHQHPDKVTQLQHLTCKKVLVHCGIGKRAAAAGVILERARFSDVTIVNPGGYSQLA